MRQSRVMSSDSAPRHFSPRTCFLPTHAGLVDQPGVQALVMCYYRKGTLDEFMSRPATRLQYQELDVFTRVSMALQVGVGGWG
jgi:hypothetical protein